MSALRAVMAPVRTYRDRRDAGRVLAPFLGRWKDSAAIVFALPRGGVPVGVEVARALNLPLDLLHVRKIGVPVQPELALGAVVNGADPDVVMNEAIVARFGVSREEVDRIIQAELAEIARRRQRYGAGLPALDPAGRVAIIVDDGLATGASMRVAVRALRRRGALRVVAAVPVAPPDAVEGVEAEGAEVVCPLVTDDFFGVGLFYQEFRQLDDADVIASLGELAVNLPAGAIPPAR